MHPIQTKRAACPMAVDWRSSKVFRFRPQIKDDDLVVSYYYRKRVAQVLVCSPA